MPPLVTRPKAATVGVGRQVILRPALQKRYVELDEPTLADQRTDLERLRDAIDDLDLRVEVGVLRRLPRVLRDAGFRVTCVVVGRPPRRRRAGRHDRAPATRSRSTSARRPSSQRCSTSRTGTPLAVRSRLNRQQPFGADVISRISATMLDPTALERLRDLARETLQELAEEVCEQGEVDPGEVYEVALAGNATMTQLALGIDPEPLGVAPFIMAAQIVPGHARVGARASPCIRAPARRCSPPSAPTSAATSSRACSRPG